MKIMRFRFIGLFLLIAFSLSAQESDVKYLNDSVPVRWAFVPDVDGKAISVDDRWWCNFEDQLLRWSQRRWRLTMIYAKPLDV